MEDKICCLLFPHRLRGDYTLGNTRQQILSFIGEEYPLDTVFVEDGFRADYTATTH